MSARILVVDDEPNMREMLADVLGRAGHAACACASGEDALRLLESATFDGVVMDLKLPGISGAEALRALRRRADRIPVIMISAYGTVDTAVAALKDGAFDFLVKPFRNQDLLHAVQRGLEASGLLRLARDSRPGFDLGPGAPPLLGESPPMRDLFSQMQRLADTDVPVLVIGETGTGKELVARALHWSGGRRHGPWIAVNCAALPEALIESELFGHERGAFTGAHAAKLGRFEAGDGGTVFLDEIGELAPNAQAKLLRTLESGEVTRVGGVASRHVNARVIAATNVDLQSAVQTGRFRPDLYYRLAVVTLRLPPLRARLNDLEPLSHHFIRQFESKYGRELGPFAAETLAAMRAYTWPGNVRELMHAIERAVILADPRAVLPPAAERTGEGATAGETCAPGNAPTPTTCGAAIRPLKDAVRDAERDAVVAALRVTDGARAAAAELLDVSVKTLYNKIRELGIDLGLNVQ
ncbi:MAG: sigma-54-dependent Fis family transcriptional regulator [Candidatus Schekmanbacteria bacterium]|nr:sigma-54-dependent Fis family transcriptional regulator [Candidatus Schekmanbacteria bacterium]